MIDINFLKSNPEAVKENIRKKFQDKKLPLVDKVIELDDVYGDGTACGRGSVNNIIIDGKKIK